MPSWEGAALASSAAADSPSLEAVVAAEKKVRTTREKTTIQPLVPEMTCRFVSACRAWLHRLVAKMALCTCTLALPRWLIRPIVARMPTPEGEGEGEAGQPGEAYEMADLERGPATEEERGLAAERARLAQGGLRGMWARGSIRRPIFITMRPPPPVLIVVQPPTP
ncbi:hypothetical protein GGTG_09261 [Gaeumannomyces tritici R3-111a-1]|uniref:Uncharacterized protein n=1 Tax=Gaeumannomyces tritici (strain R3-111a-1) TaxID=644352 RepID=J3P6W9_GAET3|nr:hypothetical protein GGTG_09261 [Gaeumannomyces tritici R3-111a-1]EJT72395.1 hypothetical protein GGTG_09261 [Gaeumannomyces tritici R3-111a-1]